MPLCTYVDNGDRQQGNAALVLASGLCTIGQTTTFTTGEMALCAGMGLIITPVASQQPTVVPPAFSWVQIPSNISNAAQEGI